MWRWALWWALLIPAVIFFTFVMAPVWIGIRVAAWLAEFRARRGAP